MAIPKFECEFRMTPRRILLATDLTSRSDRAQDRSLQLAHEWNAELHIVHAVREPQSAAIGASPLDPPERYPDVCDDASRRIRRDLDADVAATLHIEEKVSPAEGILAVAEREACDLIVLGEARDRLFGPALEGTIEQVVRKSPASVLLVRDRPRRPYRQLLVGTDFTDEAQQAMVMAAGLFPDASITLMHVFSVPYASLLDAPPDVRDWVATHTETLSAHIAAAPLPADRKASIRRIVEHGPLGATLRRHVVEQAVDLTVIGAHPRGMLFDAFVGNSRRIVDAVQGDILMVRALRTPPSAGPEGTGNKS